MIYYTEYPTGQFNAASDYEAKKKSNARVIYKESESKDGKPFIIIRDRIGRNTVNKG